MSIGDTQEHQLGIYPEKESLCFNILNYMPYFFYLIDNLVPYQSIGDFPVNFMMNQFNLSNWYDNDESDLNESIDLIKDYDDDITDRLS